MIIVKIWGGLGNQLFQYSFGKYLSGYLQTPVKFDIKTSDEDPKAPKREFGLSLLNLSIDKASATEIRKLNKLIYSPFYRLQKKLAGTLPGLFHHYMVETDANTASNTPLRNNCYYEGYWQCYKYPEAIKKELQQMITVNYPLDEHTNKIQQQIANTLSVSLHVRRQDYLTHPVLRTCPASYYKKAISHFNINSKKATFFVFSDDIAWCKENFKDGEYIFISGNSAAQDLALMSNCKHNVIANSTFSWWGAWLNQNRDKIIISPADWFKNKETSKQLLPQTWIKIKE